MNFTIGISLFIVILSFAGFIFLKYINLEDATLNREIKIVTSNEIIDTFLDRYKAKIGNDLPGYKNHLYRVLTYSLHYLNGDTTFLPQIGIALVYHDIGLWTDSTLAYLEPSSIRAESEGSAGFNAEETQLVKDIIYWHHKITPFQGPHENIVNAVRRSDWIDASKGVIPQGMPRSLINQVNTAIPAAGFHDTLAGIGPRIHGNNFVKIISEIVTIFKW